MPILSHDELVAVAANSAGVVVDGFIQADSLNILVGDSGMGKSALLMQLGICVASGLKFLGLNTRQGPAIYVDYENSTVELSRSSTNLLSHLGLSKAPDAFKFLCSPKNEEEILEAIVRFKPVLVIVDALRGFNSLAEKDNSNAAAWANKLTLLAKKYKCSFLFLHHIRKRDLNNPPPKLADQTTNTLEWLEQSSGGRSLINQTDTRCGIELSSRQDADLCMRGHSKMTGEIGPWLIARIYDDQGEAMGYTRLRGIDQLSPTERDRFNTLPPFFTWKDAQFILFPDRKGGGGKALSQLIKRAIAAGILHKEIEGKDAIYHKR